MPLLLTELRPLVPTPLNDVALQALVTRIEAEVTDVIGAEQTGVVELTEVIDGGDTNIFVRRPINTVTTVTEYSSRTDTTGVALTEDEEFYVWPREGRLERIGGSLPRAAPSVMAVFHMSLAQFEGRAGFGGAWGSHVEVVYRPRDQRGLRNGAVIDLCRVWLSRTALMSESVAREYSYQAPPNWDAEKRRIMRRLSFIQA